MIQDSLQQYLGQVREANPIVSVVLVGSVARGTDSDRSDLDLLVVAKEAPQLPPAPKGFHVASSSVTKFLEKLRSGEDFEAWCVRLGVVLHDDGFWMDVKSRPESSLWPSWQKKILHGTRRLFLSGQLIQVGDLGAASEEMLYALGHAGRGLLLKANTFPLSRPELEGQLEAIKYPHLALAHRRLRVDEHISLDFLRQCQRYAKKLLCHLDTALYGQYARDFRHKQLIRAEKRRLTRTVSTIVTPGVD
jgi:Nucleotidyltransferase domain